VEYKATVIFSSYHHPARLFSSGDKTLSTVQSKLRLRDQRVPCDVQCTVPSKTLREDKTKQQDHPIKNISVRSWRDS